MQTELYDKLMAELEKELLLDHPDVSRIRLLVEDTGCPHLIKLVGQRINEAQEERSKEIGLS